MGQSRTENILENMLGASNPLGAPQSREEALLMQILDKISVMDKAIIWQGVTTTEITDGSSTNPVIIDGASYTAKSGDMVTYNSTEFVFNGTVWQEFGAASTIFIETLTAGDTTITITSSQIAIGSTVDVYTDVYGLEPTNVSVTAGQIVLTFNAQGVDVNVKVKVI